MWERARSWRFWTLVAVTRVDGLGFGARPVSSTPLQMAGEQPGSDAGSHPITLPNTLPAGLQRPHKNPTKTTMPGEGRERLRRRGSA